MIGRKGPRTARAVCGALAGLLTLAGFAPRHAMAQSSTNFKLLPGSLTAIGGSSSSTNFRMVGETKFATSRTSSDNFDVVSGFIGGAFSSQATSVIQTTGGQFASIGFPLRSTSNTVSSLLQSLGSPDRTKWRFGHFSPPDSAYLETGGTLPLTTISRGLGYWLITKGNETITTTGLPARTDQVVTVALQNGPSSRPGWNQVANPFTFPIVNTLIAVDNTMGTAFLMSNAANTLTLPIMKVRTGNTYTDATVINGRQAFWIKKLVTGPVNLLFAPVPSATGTPEPALVKPEGALWAVVIRGSQGDRATETMMLGAAAVPATGWNSLSIPRGPNPPGGEDLGLFVSRRDWQDMNDDYVRLFQPPTERMAWDVTLAGTDGPGEVTLRIDGLDLPAGMRVYLTDALAGWTREVEPGQTLRVAVGTARKNLRVEVASSSTPVATSALVDGFRNSYPNPFHGQTGLTFTLARPGAVSVDVFDVQGRLIRRLERPAASPGDQVLVWDGLDADGRAAGSGVYLARWRAGAAQGSARLVRIE